MGRNVSTSASHWVPYRIICRSVLTKEAIYHQPDSIHGYYTCAEGMPCGNDPQVSISCATTSNIIIIATIVLYSEAL